jgi:hypothetical protein
MTTMSNGSVRLSVDQVQPVGVENPVDSLPVWINGEVPQQIAADPAANKPEIIHEPEAEPRPRDEREEEDLDRFAHFDTARLLKVPGWVVAGGFTEYVLASRHFAAVGNWPNGIRPHCPTLRYLEIWQCKWLKFQAKPQKLADWKHKHRERRKNKSNRPIGPKHIATRKAFTETPDDWQAENAERQRQIAIGRDAGMPPFVALYGFTEFVTASRYFAEHEAWPAGKPPQRPDYFGLSIWQIKWIRAQRFPNGSANRDAELKQRTRYAATARKPESAAKATKAASELTAEIMKLGPNDPLPSALTSLAEIWLARKKAKVAA